MSTDLHVQTAAMVQRPDPPSLLLLTGVELRKAVDTRAGRWLLAVVGVLSLATSALMLTAAPRREVTLEGLLSFAAVPVVFLVPVLGVLLVTAEWTQRTAMTTFTLVPRRESVVAAKLLAAGALALACGAVVLVASIAATALAQALGRGARVSLWTLHLPLVLNLAFLVALGAVTGAALGLLLRNSIVALVAYFAAPFVVSVLAELVGWVRRSAGWYDLNRAQEPLFEPGALGGSQWAHLASATSVWLLVPLALGIVRLRRPDIG